MPYHPGMSHGAKADKAQRVAQFTSAKVGRPLWMRGLNTAGRLAPRWLEASAEAWWEEARAKEPEAGEPTPEAVAALDALVHSINETAALNVLGRFSARDDTVRMARTHLRVERALRETPAILDEGIPPPLFIVGWPRTGSTALHTLLAEDPQSRTIPYWESFDPVPPEKGADRRIERLGRMLSQLERFAPDYHAIHPMAPQMTEECVALFMNHFRTLQFDFQYRVPGYVAWLLEQDARIAYEAYHRSLHLIHHFRAGGQRFVLKDPTHLVHLDVILSIWPDAKIVFTHRDPVAAISSLCSLHAHTRAIFSDDVDPLAIGREVMAGHWPRALDSALALRERLAPGQYADVRHVDLLRDPIGSVEGLYATLDGLALDDDARAAMQRFLDEEAKKPNSVHEHSPAGFGLDPGAIRERFRGYCEHFDLGSAY
ncbi:MAG: sulfotransferase [Deltaproteobacteria bacterium]|nr:sulfotransferase [Deltaproteobacteria bacterium]